MLRHRSLEQSLEQSLGLDPLRNRRFENYVAMSISVSPLLRDFPTEDVIAKSRVMIRLIRVPAVAARVNSRSVRLFGRRCRLAADLVEWTNDEVRACAAEIRCDLRRSGIHRRGLETAIMFRNLWDGF